MKKVILILFLLTLSSNLFCHQPNEIKPYRKECLAFENQHVNIKLYKKDNYQIAYQADDGRWVTVEVNWSNAFKYSISYVFVKLPVLKKAL